MDRTIHKKNAQLHCNSRVQERLGVHFNRHKAHEIIGKIKRGEFGQGYPASSDERTWYFGIFENDYVWFLYDKKLKRLVTALDGYEVPRNVYIYCLDR